MIFTAAEMDDLWHDYKPMSCREYTRHIESKLLEKLCAGVVMPEAVGQLYGIAGVQHCTTNANAPDGPLHTADQLRAYGAAQRLKALEDAAQIAEHENTADWSISGQIAKQIRALKGETT